MTHSTSIGSRLRIPVGHLLKLFEDRVFGTLNFILNGHHVVPVPVPVLYRVRAVLIVSVFDGLAKVEPSSLREPPGCDLLKRH